MIDDDVIEQLNNQTSSFVKFLKKAKMTFKISSKSDGPNYKISKKGVIIFGAEVSEEESLDAALLHEVSHFIQRKNKFKLLEEGFGFNTNPPKDTSTYDSFLRHAIKTESETVAISLVLMQHFQFTKDSIITQQGIEDIFFNLRVGLETAREIGQQIYQDSKKLNAVVLLRKFHARDRWVHEQLEVDVNFWKLGY